MQWYGTCTNLHLRFFLIAIFTDFSHSLFMKEALWYCRQFNEVKNEKIEVISIIVMSYFKPQNPENKSRYWIGIRSSDSKPFGIGNQAFGTGNLEARS
jgi:hypothetical protein